MTTFAELLKLGDGVEPEPWYDVDELAQELDVNDWWCTPTPDGFETQFKVVRLHTWMCTDTRVGYFAHYYNDELIAITYQSARKSDKVWLWVSNETANRIEHILRDQIMQLVSTFDLHSDIFWKIV